MTLSLAVNTKTSDAAEKLRAAFFGIGAAEDDERRIALLKQHGFNAALICDSSANVNIPRWNALAQLADRYDLRLFPIYTFAGTAEIKAWRGSFAPYVTPDGTQMERTPCPLDAAYWEQAVAARWEALALLSKQSPFAGVLIDTEMYGGDFAVYEEPCLCDSCWQEFIITLASANIGYANMSEQIHLPITQRRIFLKTHHLWPNYVANQEQRLQQFAAQIERRIHRVNSALTLGIVAHVDNWFYRGLVQGLGTLSQPVFVFSETFYIRGYSADVLTEQERIKQGSVARYVPGLWQGRFFPDDLPAQASQLAQHTDGYWFFTADSLWTDEPKTGHYALHGTPAEYWAAWKTANAIVPAENDAQSSPSVYDPKTERLRTSPRLKTLLRNVLNQATPSWNDTNQIVYEEQTLFHFLPRPDGVIHVTVATSTSSEAAPIIYRLFDQAGRLAQAGTCSDGVVITLPPDASGMMSFLISPKRQGVRVAFGEMAWVVEASVTFPFASRMSSLIGRYAVYPEQEYVRFKVTSYNSAPVSVISFSPDEVEQYRLQFQNFGEILFAINKAANTQRDQLWRLEVTTSSTETMRWHYFYQTSLPYLILMTK